MPVSAAMYMLSPSWVDGFWDLIFSCHRTSAPRFHHKEIFVVVAPYSPIPKIQDGRQARTISPCHHRALVRQRIAPYGRMLLHKLMRAFPTPSIENSTTNGRRVVGGAYAQLSCASDRSLARQAQRRFVSSVVVLMMRAWSGKMYRTARASSSDAFEKISSPRWQATMVLSSWYYAVSM